MCAHSAGLHRPEQGSGKTCWGWPGWATRARVWADLLGLARVGDPSKELSGEFSLTLKKSLAPASGNYPIKRAPRQPLSSAAAHPAQHSLLLWGCSPKVVCN